MIDAGTGRFLTRGLNNATWGPWRRVVDDGGAAEFGGHLTPTADALHNLGSASRRLNNSHFAVSPTITSDGREKQIVEDEETFYRLVVAFSRVPIRLYKWLRSIAEKGEAGARIHIGPIAQEIEAALIEAGLDPYAFGLLGKDFLLQIVTRAVLSESGEPVLDENGQPVMETVEEPILDADGQPAYRLSVRPDQLSAVALAALKLADDRRHAEIQALTARADAQEARFDALMAALADAQNLAGIRSAAAALLPPPLAPAPE